MRLVISLCWTVFLWHIKGQTTEAPNHSCNQNGSAVKFTLSVSFHSAWDPISNCSLSQCDVRLGYNNSCLSALTPCFDYRTLSNNRYCAPGILCSILEPCNNITYSCASNTSVCVINSCCSIQAVCLPLSWTDICISALSASLNVRPGTAYAVWNTFAGGNNTLATESSSGVGTYPAAQSPSNLFDGNLHTAYSSRGSSNGGINNYAGLNTGFFVTIAQCQPVLTGFRFGNVYNNSNREPLVVTVEGTNCANVASCTNWTLLYSNGSTGLDTQENFLDYGEYQSITNSDVYQSYRFLVTEIRGPSAFASYSEVELFGYASSTTQNATSNTTSLFVIRSGSVEPLWNTYVDGSSTIAVNGTTGPGVYYAGQSADNLFDGKFNTRYTSRGNSTNTIDAIAGLNTGFYATVAKCQPTLTSFRIATASAGSIDRDPLFATVEGTNCNTLSNCTTWTLLYSGTTGLDTVTSRSTFGNNQTIPIPQAFSSYRLLITQKRNNSDFVSYSEVELYGY